MPQLLCEWDRRFMQEAVTVSTWSKDPSTKCGAAIVSPNRKLIVKGYNGFPSGMDDNPDLLANRDYKYSLTVHAEMNACINAKQNLDGWSLYVWPLGCCDRCAAHMIQFGITRVVFPSLAPEQERWRKSVEMGIAHFRKKGVTLVEFDRQKYEILGTL